VSHWPSEHRLARERFVDMQWIEIAGEGRERLDVALRELVHKFGLLANGDLFKPKKSNRQIAALVGHHQPSRMQGRVHTNPFDILQERSRSPSGSDLSYFAAEEKLSGGLRNVSGQFLIGKKYPLRTQHSERGQ
jgi:hypothetical protein